MFNRLDKCDHCCPDNPIQQVMDFITNNSSGKDDDQEGMGLFTQQNKPYLKPPCACCVRSNHPTNRCIVKKSTVLFTNGENYEVIDTDQHKLNYG